MPVPGSLGHSDLTRRVRGSGPFFPASALPGPAAQPPSRKFAPASRYTGRPQGAECRKCGLPLGEAAYYDRRGQATLHAECAAVDLIKEVQEKEATRQRAKILEKQKHRREYDIGWKPERVPRNGGLASKLGCDFLAKHGLCCLAFEEEARTVRVVEGMEPSACVNLEYLSLALQVRMQAGREPLFSLDPIDPKKDPRNCKQAKRFEPEWLMGTSLGEVMYQADYHLKELSMGEYEQPVLGMKSCFDFTEGFDKEWFARAWFVINDAEVYVTEDNILIPRVEMGVEAREQEKKESGVTDAPVTRPDHPMVKYAEGFTHNFDLVAERKSVVHHLREAAKASILAKFLLEAQVKLDERWFDLVDWSAVKEAALGCILEIPQLWKDRTHSELRVKDGAIVDAQKGVSASTVSLYGGVEFGLGRFTVPPGRRAPGHMLTAGAGLMAQTISPTRGILRPQGVDLNLDKFDLSEPTKLGARGPPPAVMAGRAFWSCVDGKTAPPAGGDEDVALLKQVFNPHQSDRRSEGERFVCPDLSPSYTKKLKQLLSEEAEVRKQRKDHFFSKDFVIGDAGDLFPSSWSFSVEVAQALDLQRSPCNPSAVAAKDLKLAVVVFDKSTEDGVRFRIYKHKNFEVRTTQDHDGAELIGAVYSFAQCRQDYCIASMQGNVKGDEKVVKVTVASVDAANMAASKEAPASERKSAPASERKDRLAKLIYSNGALRGDREVVMAAVERDGLTLQRAADDLKADREIVQAAVQDKGGALEFASEALRRDREVVMTAIREDACALEHASEELRGDREVAAEAVQHNSFAISSVAPSMRSDREIILASVQRNPFALEHASEELMADHDFLLAVVRKNALVLEDIPKKIRANRDFMLKVVRGNGFALKYASKELRADGEIILAAIDQDSRASEYADREALTRALEERSRPKQDDLRED